MSTGISRALDNQAAFTMAGRSMGSEPRDTPELPGGLGNARCCQRSGDSPRQADDWWVSLEVDMLAAMPKG